MSKLTADIWLGLRTAPARALLAFISLLIGLFALTILLATLDALQLQTRHLIQRFGAGSIVLTPADSPSPWTRAHADALQQNLAGAATVSAIHTVENTPNAAFTVVAADASLARARNWTLLDGRALDALDIQHAQRHAVAAHSVARELHWRVGDLISLDRELFRLVGIFADDPSPIAARPARAVCIPHTANALAADRTDTRQRIDALLLSAAPPTSPETLLRRTRALVQQFPPDQRNARWLTPDTLLRDIRHWQRTIGWTVGSATLLALLMGSATLSGLLLSGARERIPEIGLRRTLGARPRDIAALFVTEALALTLAAAALGIAAAEILLRLLAARLPLDAHFGWPSRTLPPLLALLLALLCSLAPALRAARLPPAEALRND